MDPLLLLIILALIAVTITMAMGLITMGGGGETDKDFGTPLMWARVVSQGVVIVLLFLAIILR